MKWNLRIGPIKFLCRLGNSPEFFCIVSFPEIISIMPSKLSGISNKGCFFHQVYEITPFAAWLFFQTEFSTLMLRLVKGIFSIGCHIRYSLLTKFPSVSISIHWSVSQWLCLCKTIFLYIFANFIRPTSRQKPLNIKMTQLTSAFFTLLHQHQCCVKSIYLIKYYIGEMCGMFLLFNQWNSPCGKIVFYSIAMY